MRITRRWPAGAAPPGGLFAALVRDGASAVDRGEMSLGGAADVWRIAERQPHATATWWSEPRRRALTETPSARTWR